MTKYQLESVVSVQFIHFSICFTSYMRKVSKVDDPRREWPEGSPFDSYYTTA